ncbi:hypothetical protein HP15_3573 [Marinobacter adhaerens HP15]|uniref:Uncharacterized protein n=1 Tax=Marinobacter adhaerens (strain DSM 23420 / HP15) TaxID=225937 RepID=E4PGM8_MARAH|nr:hypothetical protein HP15_3573 [Marinobacter adhaerens HP15]
MLIDDVRPKPEMNTMVVFLQALAVPGWAHHNTGFRY